MKFHDPNPRPQSRPTYVRLELSDLDKPAPESLLQLVGTLFQDSHAILISYCYKGIVSQNSYRKACEVNKRKLPHTTYICECSFTPNPCHKCHSIPTPAGSSVSHGDWNWERLLRRRVASITYQPLSLGEGDTVSRLTSHLIPESPDGRWDNQTLFDYQTQIIRNPQKKWEYALMSLWNVTDLSKIPIHQSNYRPGVTINLELVESELRLFQQPDTRFLEWLIRNEI